MNTQKTKTDLPKGSASFMDRIRATRPTRWVRFGLVALVWAAFSLWVGAWWLWLVLILLFDIYITGYIPFTWWKKSKNATVRTVMSWVDAIVYALVLVYFVFAFIGQNYQIPSSSLEKTLLTGDYLFVNKTVYGPRVPMTPIHFPLAHNTWPIFGGKSYSDWPTLKYKRLKGQRNVEAGDIVVFNFPAGDTVMSKCMNPDYYQLIEMYGGGEKGRFAVNHNPMLGEKIYRPVDRRENYVKRAVGLPGQRFRIVDGQIFIDGKPQAMPENVQFNYLVQTTGNAITPAMWDELGVSEADREVVTNTSQIYAPFADYMGLIGFSINRFATSAPIYDVPLTPAMVEKLRSMPGIDKIERKPAVFEYQSLYPFELSAREHWTRADYGGEEGILIPKKGMTVDLDYDNWLLYERPIRVYEGNTSAEWRDGKVYIDGKPADTYTFGMDYYFMMGDNRDNSLDSRYWGFVPEDHIVGTPWRVLVSFDGEKKRIRFDRIFKDANPDKIRMTNDE